VHARRSLPRVIRSPFDVQALVMTSMWAPEYILLTRKERKVLRAVEHYHLPGTAQQTRRCIGRPSYRRPSPEHWAEKSREC
jgi:hypothetical protein